MQTTFILWVRAFLENEKIRQETKQFCKRLNQEMEIAKNKSL
jgi:hypothetical protein